MTDVLLITCWLLVIASTGALFWQVLEDCNKEL